MQKIEQELNEVLKPELKEIVQILKENKNINSVYNIQIPDDSSIDLSIEQLMSLVARSSNIYGKVSRLAGIARAEQKLAKGRYDRKYKQSLQGPNGDARIAYAMLQSDNEHSEYMIAEALAELAESLESAARVASESCRKLLDKSSNMYIAQGREEKGSYTKKDFNP